MTPTEKTVAIFGGAFDPPTVAHAEVVRAVLDAKLADEVWIMPTCRHMYGKSMVSFRDRLAMCDILAGPFKQKVRISDVEEQLVKNNKEYQGSTFELLLHLFANAPKNQYRVIIGLDNALDLHRWKYNDVITSIARFIVLPRPGYKHDPDAWYMTEKDEQGLVHHYLDTYQTSPVSSTEVREALHKWWGTRTTTLPDTMKTMLDQKVLEYILGHDLYQKT